MLEPESAKRDGIGVKTSFGIRVAVGAFTDQVEAPMTRTLERLPPSFQRTVFSGFRAGKTIFDLSLEWQLPYSEIEKIIRLGIDSLERPVPSPLWAIPRKRQQKKARAVVTPFPSSR
ncbi:MAG TPA: hypothetical protein VFA54_16955 [Bryobacterales bacterium]|nr:hypothetical protein [Bryobacterales bacterium]